MIKFDKKFEIGVSLSGPQTEGNKNKVHKNIMDYWFKNNPKDFFNQQGPDLTCEFYDTYKEKLKWL
ncbi:hypothetical protein [Spiroplasma endosymbiont of Atherix ibis]|uniref:hypothetical protein n=1 Tax=Spiroplasma endosymbiont of Atherix ibis TaxID=3066291 RepID=UPI0030D0798E